MNERENRNEQRADTNDPNAARDLSDWRFGMNSSADRNTQAGFSLIELLIVCALIIILTAMAIFAMVPSRNAFRTDDQALQILNLMRQASQRSLTQRQPQRLEINLTTNVIRLIDENTASSTDDVVIVSQTLNNPGFVRMSTTPTVVSGVMTGTSKPTNVTLPTAPAQPNFPAALFVNDASSNSVWSVRYLSDGRVVNSAGSIVSATLFLWTPLSNSNTNAADLQKVRAISFFGATGTTKLWAYTGTGTNFVAK